MPNVPPLTYAKIRSRLLGTPLMIRPENAEAVIHVLGPRLGITAFEGRSLPEVTADLDDAPVMHGVHPDRGYASNDRQPYEIANGIAFIPVYGSIVQKYDFYNAMCGNTSTEALTSVVRTALADPEVRGVYLDIDSGGGEVAGIFDAVDAMIEAKRASGKPVHAHAGEMAASAAYAIATVADHISTPRTGTTGSVGVICLHMEQSKFLENVGYTVTVVRRGEQKARANGLETLTDEAHADLQEGVDEAYELFVSSVVANRPALSRDTVVGTESRLLRAAEALRLGFIDAVMSEEEAISHILARTG